MKRKVLCPHRDRSSKMRLRNKTTMIFAGPFYYLQDSNGILFKFMVFKFTMLFFCVEKVPVLSAAWHHFSVANDVMEKADEIALFFFKKSLKSLVKKRILSAKDMLDEDSIPNFT